MMFFAQVVAADAAPMTAPAAPAPQDQLLAETHTREGRRLMGKHRAADACVEFGEADKLWPRAISALEVGDCQEVAGYGGAAWDWYKRAAKRAQAEGDARVRVEAEARANRLGVSFARFRCAFLFEERPADLQVRLDGKPIDIKQCEVARAIDPALFFPGKHTVRVTATGRKPWESAFEVGAGREVLVSIPALQVDAHAPPPVATGTQTADQLTTPSAAPSPEPAKGVAPAAPAEPPPPVVSRWKSTLYGYITAAFIHDSTQSFGGGPTSNMIQRPGTYRGDNGRFFVDVRATRLGVKVDPPPVGESRLTGIVEFDFFGDMPSDSSEKSIYASPVPQLRNAVVKITTPIVDVIAGQFWSYTAFQPTYQATNLGNVPGEPLERVPQIRVTKTLQTKPLDIELGVVAQRPPQRDSELPQAGAGLRLMANEWKGPHIVNDGSLVDQRAMIGVTGVAHQIRIPEFAARPSSSSELTGYLFAAIGLIPIIPASSTSRANAVTATGHFTKGAGASSGFGGLSGGVTFPQLPAPAGTTPPAWNAGVDAGTAGINTATGELALIEWQSWRAGLEYYLPPSGNIWVAGHYAQLESSNVDHFAPKGLKKSEMMEVAVLGNITSYFRVVLTYSHIRQEFVDGIHASNDRAQVASFYFF